MDGFPNLKLRTLLGAIFGPYRGFFLCAPGKIVHSNRFIMSEATLKLLSTISFYLMTAAALLHWVQLFIYPITPKFIITATGGLAYTVAAVGIYSEQLYGYYITALVPVAGVCIGIIILVFGLREKMGYTKINPYTLTAAIVESPAVVMCIIILYYHYKSGPA